MAVAQAFSETWNLTTSTLQAMWQIVIGTRASDELGGPLRIAQMSGEVAQYGFVAVLSSTPAKCSTSFTTATKLSSSTG